MKLEFSKQIFEKYSKSKFHENSYSGSRVPCVRTNKQTDMTKLTVAFRNFANAPKNVKYTDFARVWHSKFRESLIYDMWCLI